MISFRLAFVMQIVVHIAGWVRLVANNAAARGRIGVVGEADGT
jgi:hypothetical protein